jgi:hypothetical protein
VEVKKEGAKKNSGSKVNQKSLELIPETTQGSQETVQSMSIIDSIFGICTHPEVTQTELTPKNFQH